jgi:hypothetical protein
MKSRNNSVGHSHASQTGLFCVVYDMPAAGRLKKFLDVGEERDGYNIFTF